MTLSTEHLKGAKKDIELAVAAIETGDDSDVSQEGRDLVEQLASLDDVQWDRLRSDLEDDDLRNALDVLRRQASDAKELSADVFSPIRQIGHHLSLDFGSPSLVVRLRFHGETSSFESRQDLEDTLWIGAVVVEIVRRTIRKMDDVLSPEAKSACIGDNFEERLKQAEDAVGEIRRMFTAIRTSDATDD